MTAFFSVKKLEEGRLYLDVTILTFETFLIFLPFYILSYKSYILIGKNLIFSNPEVTRSNSLVLTSFPSLFPNILTNENAKILFHLQMGLSVFY